MNEYITAQRKKMTPEEVKHLYRLFAHNRLNISFYFKSNGILLKAITAQEFVNYRIYIEPSQFMIVV